MPGENGVGLEQSSLGLLLAHALETKNLEPVFMKMYMLTEAKEFLTLG